MQFCLQWTHVVSNQARAPQAAVKQCDQQQRQCIGKSEPAQGATLPAESAQAVRALPLGQKGGEPRTPHQQMDEPALVVCIGANQAQVDQRPEKQEQAEKHAEFAR